MTVSDQVAEKDTAEKTEPTQEEKKNAAIAALAEKKKAKQAAKEKVRKDQLTELKGQLKKGQKMFLTRAVFYGMECIVLGIEDVRGRNLVKVEIVSTKKGRALEADKHLIRRVSPKFLVEERPTEAYVQRRGPSTKSESNGEEAEEAPEDAVDDGAADDEGTEADAVAEVEAEDEADEKSESKDEAEVDSWG